VENEKLKTVEETTTTGHAGQGRGTDFRQVVSQDCVFFGLDSNTAIAYKSRKNKPHSCGRIYVRYMIEKIKLIRNPLTIIAIFAALAEVAGTVALATIDKSVQSTFIWFVMGFPVLLVVLFFLTLNFNPRVLYAPSDFKDEANFIRIVMGSKKLSADFDTLSKLLETAKEQIVNQVAKEVGTRDVERKRLSQEIAQHVELIRQQLEATRQSAKELASEATAEVFPRSRLQTDILSLLSSQDRMVSLEEIAAHCKMSNAATQRALDRLEQQGFIIRGDEEGNNWAFMG